MSIANKGATKRKAKMRRVYFMQNEIKNKLSLKSNLPDVVQLNRPLVIGVLGIVAFLIILAVIGAFSTQAPKAQKTTLPNEVQNTDTTTSSALKDLPQNYQDINAIKKFQAQNVSIPPAVQQELEALKQQQIELQSRLSGLNSQNMLQNAGNAQNQQAKASGIFFIGSSPTQEDLNAAKNAANQAADKNAKKTSEGDGQTAYDKQNNQQGKINFLKPDDTDDTDIYNPHAIVGMLSKYEVQAGSLIPAALLTPIQSSLPGDIVAIVRQDVYDSVTGAFLLIPKGSKLLGIYDSQVTYGQTRILVVFNRIIRPDGSSILLEKYTGADAQGAAGMQGNVDNHWLAILGAATLTTAFAVGAGIASDNQISNNSNQNYTNSKQNAMLGAANGVTQVGSGITERALNVAPTITRPAGYEFNIIVKKDMILTPYSSQIG